MPDSTAPAPPRLDRLFNVHHISEQILQHISLLYVSVIRFQGMTLSEQTSTDPRTVQREYLDPLFGLVGAFLELDQIEGGRALDPFIAAARSLGLDSSRRKFRNIECSSVHGLMVRVGLYFLQLWHRAFDPESRIVIPVASRIQRFMGEAHTCLADLNPTPYKTDLDREYLEVSGRPPTDGPAPPNLLWWKGERHKLAPKPWSMLNYLWNKDSVEVQDVAKAVWEAEGLQVLDSTIRSTLTRLNNELMRLEIPRNYRITSGRIVRS